MQIVWSENNGRANAAGVCECAQCFPDWEQQFDGWMKFLQISSFRPQVPDVALENQLKAGDSYLKNEHDLIFIT